MAIINPLPATIANGQLADATVVMTMINWLLNQTNANGCPATSGTSILKGDGAGGTTAASPGTDYSAPIHNGTYAVSTNVGNAYTVTLPTGLAYTAAAGDMIVWQANVANSGAATLSIVSSVSGTFGPTSLAQGGSLISISGALSAGDVVVTVYDGTYWDIVSIGKTIKGVTVTPSTATLTTSNGRTYTFANRNGTIADDTDLAGKAALAGSAAQDFAVKKLTAADTITPSSTNGIVGTTTNDNAVAGSIGEYVESSIASGSAVALTTGTVANVTSISLTAGDWDVVGNVFIQGQAGVTSYTRHLTGISLTSATGELPYQTSFHTPAVVPATALSASLPSAMRRISIASTTTVYFIALANFTAGTASAYGFISARRTR